MTCTYGDLRPSPRPRASFNLSCTGEVTSLREVVSAQKRYGVARHFSVRLPGINIVWDSHTEFATWGSSFDHPFEQRVLYEVPHDWIESLPGQTIRPTQVAVAGRSTRTLGHISKAVAQVVLSVVAPGAAAVPAGH